MWKAPRALSCLTLTLLVGACREAIPAPTEGGTIVGQVDVPPPSATVQWLKSQIVPLTTTDPAAPLDDLRPLLAMIGSAHIVGLGEGTHGTREFFLMKHRILELLVREAGVRYFAIEGAWPSGEEINQYVLNGTGDPRVPLSTIDAWPWNSQEVLDLIEWMRTWNSRVPAAERVQFVGFDLKQAASAINRIIDFINRHDAGQFRFIDEHIACLWPYADGVDDPGNSAYRYLPPDVRAACARDVAAVYALVRDHRAQYTAATSSVEYEQILHSARIVQQWEATAANGAFDSLVVERDRLMAENVGWIRDQAPPGAKIVVWAHNGHINAVDKRMGQYLRDQYGGDYVTLGFLFGSGQFNAVGSTLGSVNRIQPFSAPAFPASSVEALFSATGAPMALFDTRRIPTAGAAAAPLAGPILMRHIGLLYSTAPNNLWFLTRYFPADFDLLVYLSSTTPTHLLSR